MSESRKPISGINVGNLKSDVSDNHDQCSQKLAFIAPEVSVSQKSCWTGMKNKQAYLVVEVIVALVSI